MDEDTEEYGQETSYKKRIEKILVFFWDKLYY